MILTTSDLVPGKRIKKVLGLVRGNTVRSRHVGKDILASLKNITGGEIIQYTKLLAEAREQCLDRMRKEAKEIGANAIVCIRFTTASMMQGSAELLAFGTAVILEDE